MKFGENKTYTFDMKVVEKKNKVKLSKNFLTGRWTVSSMTLQ